MNTINETIITERVRNGSIITTGNTRFVARERYEIGGIIAGMIPDGKKKLTINITISYDE